MDAAVTSNNRWPQGATKLHLYVVPDPADIASVRAAYAPVIARCDWLSPVPPEWMHATVLQLADRPARAVTEAQLTALTGALDDGLHRLSPISLTFGPALAGSIGVMLDTHPRRPFAHLVDHTCAAAATVFGDHALKGPGPGHLTLAYGRRRTSREEDVELARALWHVDDGRVEATIRSVQLVDVTQDADLMQYRWDLIATISLDG